MFARSSFALLLSAFVTSPANAIEAADWYGGLQAGWSKFQDVGATRSGLKEDGAGGALLGLQVNPYLSFETAYQFLGDATFSADNTEVTFQQLALLGRLGIQATERLYPYVKIGGTGWLGDRPGDDDSGLSPALGTGVAIKLNDITDLVLDYQYTADMVDHDLGHSDNHLTTLGVNWRFGRKATEVALAPAPEPEPIVEVAPTEFILTSAEALFANDSAELRDTKALTPILKAMKNHPETNAVLVGYTDNVGNANYNQQLSERRAQSIADFLIGQGINPNRLKIKGMGEQNPVADNQTALGREANRRVEITLE